MGGFLLAPFMPVESTSILTAMVWSFSGKAYAVVFAVLGTFVRFDSGIVYTAIQTLTTKAAPSDFGGWTQPITLSVMLGINLCAAFLFMKIIRHSVAKRLPTIYTMI
jgi:hypothetical protein